MRLQINLIATRTISIAVNYAEHLSAAIYGYVAAGDADYSRFVQDESYGARSDGRRYRPFTHSWLRIPSQRRRIEGDRLVIQPGSIGWIVSSPLEEFLEPLAAGLLRTGSLRIGATHLAIESVQPTTTPEFSHTGQFTCLSPIVATVRRPDGQMQYLRPADDPDGFSNAIRKNLLAKYQAIHGAPADDDRFEILFETGYLASRNGGTKLSRYKNTDIIGVLAPFTATGSPVLIRFAYEAGFGVKTAQGFGCAEVRR